MRIQDQKKVDARESYQALKFLSPAQVVMIDEALAKLGEFGELRLVIEKGCLRFLITQKSYDALKWQPSHREE